MGDKAMRPAAVPAMTEEEELLAKLKRRRRKKPADCKLNMTPMIDVVFLLIIFFMLVTEMSKMEIEAITLPYALKAVDDKEGQEKQRIIFNIDKDGKITYMRQRQTPEQVRARLEAAVRTSPRDDMGLPTLAVKIRGDATCEYKYIQDVMVQCMRAFVWRLSFGANPIENNDEERLLKFY